jgi:PTS system mannose-specific IIA component
MEVRRLDILEGVKRVDSGQGVIILTDMFGGTPSNLAISVMDESRAEVIAGISLPILVKLASIRSEVPLAEAVIMARDAGKKYIKVASQELSGG